MALRLVAVSFDVRDAGGVAAFWADLLGREIVPEPSGALVPGNDTQVGLRFVVADTEEGAGPNRLHLHLTSSDLEDQSHTVEKVVELGGRLIRQHPEEGHVVMADPGRNEFCVIEPENGFLAGCGFLAEVTCEGPPNVGRFWSEALGWPLVWDRGQQTAIQSPLGGTKVSWDVRPGSPKYGSKRQRFDLIASDLASELPRLVALGATQLGDNDGVVAMSEPGDYEFTVSTAEAGA